MNRLDVTLPVRPRPESRPAPGLQAASTSFWLWLFAVAYLAFVVYGSLVPLAYRSVPWDEAVERFRAIEYLNLGIDSRADWVANLLLFIPLAFLWAGVVWPRRQAGWRPLAALLVVACSGAWALAIEFTQIFFPPRTVSINDIVAESLGALVGVALWWRFGPATERWFQSLALARGTASVAARVLTVYLLLLYGYNLLPLDLTISPVEIYHKWRQGKVIWLPFSAPYPSLAHQLYDVASDIAIWVPVAFLWRATGRKAAGQAWTATVFSASLLEFLQVFVFSRVSDVTDILTAALGATIGCALFRQGAAPTSTPPAPGRPRLLPWLAAIVVWLGVLAVVFWYPFDFNFDRSFLRTRVEGLGRVPFEAYYYGTEFRAITEVLHKTLFMAPLGALLCALIRRLPPGWPRAPLHALAMLLIAACALAIEAGQLPLASKNADVTDALLEFLGGALGYAAGLWVARQIHPTAGPLTRRR